MLTNSSHALLIIYWFSIDCRLRSIFFSGGIQFLVSKVLILEKDRKGVRFGPS